ncbi:hypothetical protein PanWU01x14_075520 [Parasponia andersonii]|uniref:Uncharacterized protein n=1 Tax=Parasponia andersonii TaxID=3476 RepID=A0A2P5DCV4_PARAD|nr:hypothetical protein PanWU01x14_075520 [Parasponia andersonii]
METANLVFQTGFTFPEASIFEQYLLFGSIQPTANHWSLHREEERRSPRADTRHTSTQSFPITGQNEQKRDKQKCITGGQESASEKIAYSIIM